MNGTHVNGAFTVTGLAAYLTTISNTPVVRQSRVWKRFVRVRTDDLESVRVERAIKRTRSDLASHVSPKLSSEPKATNTVPSEEVTNEVEEVEGEINGEHEDVTERGDCAVSEERKPVENEEDRDAAALQEDAAIARAMVEDLSQDSPNADGARSPRTSISVNTNDPTPEPVDTKVAVADDVDDDVHVSTPIAPDPPSGRMHRSQSADPDKSSRLTRSYTSLTPGIDETTGDESSISTADITRVTRKKRSHSTDRHKQPKKSQRKVIINDFEMMRVLGKGCAGKVLLVRHKSTSNLYALKAITKRHVLAHQELQHTLTEQAVLKRMAAESKDPFVVKLWWSFHDKENLFLVMVSQPGWSFRLSPYTNTFSGFPSWR
jgi:serum/glucocorticoid-regulated kinase 2